MFLFTVLATKMDWCGCSLNNRTMDSDQRNNYVYSLDNKDVNPDVK